MLNKFAKKTILYSAIESANKSMHYRQKYLDDRKANNDIECEIDLAMGSYNLGEVRGICLVLEILKIDTSEIQNILDQPKN